MIDKNERNGFVHGKDLVVFTKIHPFKYPFTSSILESKTAAKGYLDPSLSFGLQNT